MKKIMMTLAAVLCCAMTMMVSMTSCTIDNGDNPVINPDSNVSDPLLNWGCSIDEVQKHIQAKKWWKDGNDELEFWEGTQSWHKWYWVSETFTEQYLFENQDGQNLSLVYCVCVDNNVSGNPFANLLQRQGFQGPGKPVQFFGDPYEQYLSADGKTEAWVRVDDDGYWSIWYKPNALDPLLNWGCSIAEVEQHVQAKNWWREGNDKLEFWDFPFQSWHKWYYVSDTFTEQYLFETQDGQNLRYVYIACGDNTVSGNPFVDLLHRQIFQDTGNTVQFFGDPHRQYLSADGKTEALVGVDDNGFWYLIFKPMATEPVAMADVVTLDAVPHSLYKLDTKELLPIYIAVNSAYKDDYGETQFYDLSTITDVQVSADMFDIDTSHLADNGYIKLTPKPENEETKSMLEDVEDYGAAKWESGVTVMLTNSNGEKLAKELQLVYLPKNEQKEVLNIKKSDLNENNELILDPAVIAQFGLTEWPNGRKGDYSIFDRGDLRKAQFTDDGKLLVQTWGDTTEPEEPYKLTLTFTRSLTGSPIPLLPEGEGLMVNFRYELELIINE